jgi:hypothetical protein
LFFAPHTVLYLILGGAVIHRVKDPPGYGCGVTDFR